MLKHYFSALAVTSLTHLVLAIFIYLKGRRKSTNVTYALYSFAISWWSILEAFAITTTNPNQALFLWRLNHAGVIFIPIFFVHFVVSLLEDQERQKRKPLILLSYLAGAGLLALDATDLFILEVVPKFSFRHFINPGLLYPLFFFGWVGWAVYGLTLLFRVYGRSTGARRNQLRYFCWSMLIAYIGGAPNFLPTFNIEIPLWMPFGTYAIPAYAFVTTYAIVRYRLLDVNVVLTRMAIFAIIYAPLLMLPVFLGKLFQPILAPLLGLNWWIVPTVLEAVFAVGGLVAFRYVQERTENRILAEQRKYQALLVEAAEGALKILDLAKLLKLIVFIVVKHVKLTYAAIYLEGEGAFQLKAVRGQKVELPPSFESNDPLVHYLGAGQSPIVAEELKRSIEEGQAQKFAPIGTRLIRMKASVVIPAFLRTRMIGLLVLGSKLSQSAFSSEDLKTFESLAHEMAIAIQNARRHRRTVDVERLEAAAELVTALSHEFGNVFHSLTIQVGTLAASLDSDAIPKDILKQASKRLEATAIRGRTIINDVGSFRKQSEKHGIQTFPLTPLIQDAVKTMQTRFESRPDIKVKLELPNDLPTIQGFATLPTLPLSLLADSFWALEQIPEGGEISVSVRVDRNQEQAEIRVTDPGKSLLSIIESPDPMEKAELFPERSKHSGVYVFLTRKITNDHHGTLNVMDGSENGGTTVIVRLPLVYKAETVVEEGIEDILGENSS